MPMTALALQQYCGSTALSDTRQDAPSVVQLCVPQACCPRGTFSFSSATAPLLSGTCAHARSRALRYEKLGAVNLAAAAKGRGRTKMYRVDQPARLRNGFELDSELVGRLEPGDVLRVLEERQNVNGPPNGTALCCRHTADSGEFWHQG